MKTVKFLSGIVCFFCCIQSFASGDTVYFNSRWQRVKAVEDMSFYRLPLVKTDSGYRVTDYYKEGQVQMLAYAQNEGASIYNGYKTTYFPSGQKKMEGNLLKGMREGRWIRYRSNGKIERTMTYRKDGLEGLLFKYDSMGNKRYQEEYKNDYLNGSVVNYYPRTGAVYIREHFSNGKPDSLRIVYYEDGTVKRKDELLLSRNGWTYKGKCYSRDGKKVDYFPLSEPARPKEKDDYIKKVYGNLKALPYFTGKIDISFTVEKSGKIDNIEVGKSDGDFVTDEARSVVERAIGSYWEPGKFDGTLTCWKYNFQMDMGDGQSYYNTRYSITHELEY